MALAFSPVAASEHPAKSTATNSPAVAPDSCITCHTFDTGMSHPVNITPNTTLPASLPLNAGKLTCTTCHDPDLHRQPGARYSLRKGLDSGSRCSTCHAASDPKRNPHATGGFGAHLARSKSLSTPPHSATTLDHESQSCMTCHDGSLASDAGSHRSMRSLDSEKEEHPVGIAYSSASSKLSEMKLVPAARLDARIRLFDGKLGCGSCHSPYSHVSKQLIMSNAASKLCLSCHENR